MAQRTRLKLYKAEVYEQLVKMELMAAANDTEAHKLKVKDQRYWIKVVLGGLQKTVDKRITKKFKNAVSIYDDVMSKFLKNEFVSLKTMFDEAAKHESFLMKLAAEAKAKCYCTGEMQAIDDSGNTGRPRQQLTEKMKQCVW